MSQSISRFLITLLLSSSCASYGMQKSCIIEKVNYELSDAIDNESAIIPEKIKFELIDAIHNIKIKDNYNLSLAKQNEAILLLRELFKLNNTKTIVPTNDINIKDMISLNSLEEIIPTKIDSGMTLSLVKQFVNMPEYEQLKEMLSKRKEIMSKRLDICPEKLSSKIQLMRNRQKSFNIASFQNNALSEEKALNSVTEAIIVYKKPATMQVLSKNALLKTVENHIPMPEVSASEQYSSEMPTNTNPENIQEKMPEFFRSQSIDSNSDLCIIS